MLVAIGILLLATALLAIMAARAVFLRPSPPRWTTWDTPGNLIVVVITAIAGFGCAATVMGITQIVDGTAPAWPGLTAAVAIVLPVTGGLMLRRLRVRPVPAGG